MTKSDSKVHGANIGPIWDRQDPGGPYVDPMDFAIWEAFSLFLSYVSVNNKYGAYKIDFLSDW